MEEFNVGIDSVARAFIVARELFELGTAAKLHRELPPKTPLDAWFTVLRDNQRVLDRAVRWFITERGVVAGTSISELLETFGSVVEMRHNLPEYLSGTSRERVRAKRDAGEAWGLPEELIVIWIRGFEGYALLDVIRSARDHDFEATSLAPVYFATYDRFKVDELLGLISDLPAATAGRSWHVRHCAAASTRPLQVWHCPWLRARRVTSPPWTVRRRHWLPGLKSTRPAWVTSTAS